MPKFQPQTSDDWLALHGLKGKCVELEVVYTMFLILRIHELGYLLILFFKIKSDIIGDICSVINIHLKFCR